MLCAFELLHASDNMTRTALDAGFADATHISHSVRETFGVNPAPVFREIGRWEVGLASADVRSHRYSFSGCRRRVFFFAVGWGLVPAARPR